MKMFHEFQGKETEFRKYFTDKYYGVIKDTPNLGFAMADYRVAAVVMADRYGMIDFDVDDTDLMKTAEEAFISDLRYRMDWCSWMAKFIHKKIGRGTTVAKAAENILNQILDGMTGGLRTEMVFLSGELLGIIVGSTYGEDVTEAIDKIEDFNKHIADIYDQGPNVDTHAYTEISGIHIIWDDGTPET